MIDFARPRRARVLRFVTLVGGIGDGTQYELSHGWPIIVNNTSCYVPMPFGHRTIARCDELTEIRAVASVIAFYKFGQLKPQSSQPGDWFFLGGPLDGVSQAVARFPVRALVPPKPPSAAWVGPDAPVPESLTVKTVTYRGELLAIGDHRFRLALVESLSQREAIDLLLANYRPPRLKPLGPL